MTWRSLLALGVSGGLVPCPSALVVLLSAISLNRIGYGLVLVIAFSIGLAGVLTAVGLVFVYAGRFLKKPLGASRAARTLPLLSALVITVIGAAICYEALGSVGLNLTAGALAIASSLSPGAGWVSFFSILGFGFALGLKHAVEADHLAAVTTIASESKSALKSSLAGALWGAGHTVSLLVAGVAVILFRLTISETTAAALEFAVALMLIGLGLNALRNLRRGHSHAHPHSGTSHSHFHLHPVGRHFRLKGRLTPLMVGAVHGLAGSAALLLLVVATTQSAALALMYIAVFGLGSTAGMMLVGAFISLPLKLAPASFYRVSHWMRASAGVFSVALGLVMAYEIGLTSFF